MESNLASSHPEDGANPTVGTEDLRATVALAAKTGGQFQLGGFEIDENGRLRPRPDGVPISFGFSYRGVDFMAKVDTGAPPRVSLEAEPRYPPGCPYRARRAAPPARRTKPSHRPG